MLFTHLESFQSPHPIKSLHVAARPCKAVKEQLGLFETSLRDPNQFHQTLARLSRAGGRGPGGRSGEGKHVSARMLSGSSRRRFTRAAAPGKTGPSRGLALRRFRPPRPAHVFTIEPSACFA